MNEKPTNPCSPVTDNPQEDAFYRKVEASIPQPDAAAKHRLAMEAAMKAYDEAYQIGDDGNTYISGPDSVTPKREPNKHAVKAANALYRNPADTIWLSYGCFVDWCSNAIDAARAEDAAKLSEWEEREAACCPEDVPFDKVIEILRREKAEDAKTIEHLQVLLKEANENTLPRLQEVQLIYEVTQLRRDKERLDWLEQNYVRVDTKTQTWVHSHARLRQAIDAAIPVDNAPPSSTAP